MPSPLRRTAAVRSGSAAVPRAEDPVGCPRPDGTRSRRSRLAALALTLLAVSAASTAPAYARQEPVPDRGGLMLTVSGSSNTWIRGVLLRCPSGVGNHPDGLRACAALERAHGDPGRAGAGRRPCSREYDPVTATAYGTWRDRAVRWERTYANACELDARTGPVFRF
ncbi:SSI family serine proteinase inhibitor [Streptomyces boninensis]|uniref:SSI family serine proteinase inhibitor n=1 Tax=Streptomyces boninensis TaxID=2039455 RepID=UPI003B2100DF